MKELGVDDSWEQIEIKSQGIQDDQLDLIYKLAGSYESLFSRRAMKYRKLGLHEKELTEDDYRRLILDEYTFLKRPVVLLDENMFVGNAKKTVAAAKNTLES